jgi:hypothetical protein
MDWNKHHRSRLLFFVDKDYEDLLQMNSKKDRNVFVTRYYSIENYISSVNIFEYCLRDLFKIKDNNIVKEILEKYNKCYCDFQCEMRLITAAILVFRKKNLHLELDNIKMDDLFKVVNFQFKCFAYKAPKVYQNITRSNRPASEKSLIIDQKKINLFAKAGADISEIKYRQIRANINLLKTVTDSRIFIRGKYQLWFFIRFYNNVRAMSSTINSQIQAGNSLLNPEDRNTNINLSIDINESNIFDILPMKISRFNDINIFLIHNYQQL